MDKMQFIKELDSIDANGKIHKAKLGGLIYDLVEQKIGESKGIKKDCSADCPHIMKYEESHKELQDMVKGLNEGFKSLTSRIDELEDKIDKNTLKRKTIIKLKGQDEEH